MAPMQQEQWQLRQLLDKNCGTTEIRKRALNFHQDYFTALSCRLFYLLLFFRFR